MPDFFTRPSLNAGALRNAIEQSYRKGVMDLDQVDFLNALVLKHYQMQERMCCEDLVTPRPTAVSTATHNKLSRGVSKSCQPRVFLRHYTFSRDIDF